MKSVIVYPIQSSLIGSLQVPGDKSISHRAIFFSALAEGTTHIENLLEGEDVLCTIDCFRTMGVSIEKKLGIWEVKGVGLYGLKAPEKVLYCGNSGTTMRLMMGVLAAQPFESILTGDASLNRRPMKRVMDPLSQMGAEFEVQGEGTLQRTIKIKGRKLRGISYQSPVASAQVKSAILLAGLWARGETTVIEPALSRDHTETMLSALGVLLQRHKTEVKLSPPASLQWTADPHPFLLKIPSDPSSAAFWWVASCLIPGSQLELKNVTLNPTRVGVLEALKSMGATVQCDNVHFQGGEEIGDVQVSANRLLAAAIRGEIIPRLIDEIPILAVAASQAQGITFIHDAQELKVKESNRIEVIVNLLSQLGVEIKALDDGLQIQGGKGLQGAVVQSRGDHRMAMSMAIAALVARQPITIQDVDCVQTSYPTFWEDLKRVGVRFDFKLSSIS